MPDDTAEYMLGDVLVSVVLMESNTTLSDHNHNTETWTSETIAAAKQKVMEGVTWWQDALLTEFPGATQPLSFQFDFTYADSPVATSYEPIANISDTFQTWIYDFLDQVGYNSTHNFSQDSRAFNNAQRLAHDTDWAFTVFVVNDAHDADGMFPSGGSFRRAFSYAGGQFIISPAGRPASTFAHETGHMFWARDEYSGSGALWTDHRGYYNTQNTNAIDGAPAGFVQAPSIMTTGTLLDTAYADHISSTPSLEMIGWRDSDGDGIFDVLDVPFSLTGTGHRDPDAATPTYRFQGSSTVQTLPNLNPSGLQNDITINRISRAEYRIDGGDWQLAATYGGVFTATLDLQIPLPDAALHTVDIRTVDDATGVTSVVFETQTQSWQNPALAADVTGDGLVTPLDALVLINYINSAPVDMAPPSPPAEPPPFYDTDGNGYVTPSDVLLVINWINSAPQSVASGGAAGENSTLAGAASTKPVAATAAAPDLLAGVLLDELASDVARRRQRTQLVALSRGVAGLPDGEAGEWALGTDRLSAFS
jgi:hypothetical protein